MTLDAADRGGTASAPGIGVRENVHELDFASLYPTINASARDILLNAKTPLEDAGWRVLHGIVDSIWVTPAPDRDQRPLETVAARISVDTDITLGHESVFDWVAFCPMRNGHAAREQRTSRASQESVVRRRSDRD